MLECLIFIGLPGCGKTTKRKTMVDDSFFVYSTDDAIDAYAEEQGKTYDEVFNDYYKTARSIMEKGLIEAVKARKNIAWDQTNLSARKRKQIITKIRELGKSVGEEYYIGAVFVGLPDDGDLTWNRRLLARQGKTIPIDRMKKMRESYDHPSVEEGFDILMPIDLEGNMKNSFAKAKII